MDAPEDRELVRLTRILGPDAADTTAEFGEVAARVDSSAPACWSWPVPDDIRARAQAVIGIDSGDRNRRHTATLIPLEDWQDGRTSAFATDKQAEPDTQSWDRVDLGDEALRTPRAASAADDSYVWFRVGCKAPGTPPS